MKYVLNDMNDFYFFTFILLTEATTVPSPAEWNQDVHGQWR